MTYEEAIAKVRSHSEEYDRLREAARVLEKERDRWEELRVFVMSGLAIAASKPDEQGFKVLQVVVHKMSELEKL